MESGNDSSDEDFEEDSSMMAEGNGEDAQVRGNDENIADELREKVANIFNTSVSLLFYF